MERQMERVTGRYIERRTGTEGRRDREIDREIAWRIGVDEGTDR